MHIDTGDTAFVLLSAALVMLMTPGLGFFYGGMVQGKNVINTLMLSFLTIAIVGVQWVLLGYSLAFGPAHGPLGAFLGGLDWAGLRGVGLLPHADYSATIPHVAFVAFQATFAIITPALISGAIVERMNLKSYFLFVLLWSTLVYAPIAHWVWGVGGWLRTMGVLDFAGGAVVHVSSGVSALVAAAVLGPRQQDRLGHSIPFVLLGAALLWFGWFGFNAGSALGANGIAALAFLTTSVAASAGALGWMGIDLFRRGQITALGAASGAVAGLVAITPAAGFVSPRSAIALGLLSAAACYVAVRVTRKGLKIDDSLDAFSVHGVGGFVGALLTGVFASKALNPAGFDGLIHGNPMQVLTQLLGLAAVIAYAAIGSFAILKLLDRVVGLRVPEHVENDGLDRHQHGERAYGTGFLTPQR
ncbi:MAG: ammonium transporter [bacterium]|jgi:Amt family ammonium transporter|nr:ammonium transporter [bacterium]